MSQFQADRIADEEAVIGAMILDRNMVDIADSRTVPTDYGDADCRTAFVVLRDLANSGAPYDSNTIIRALRTTSVDAAKIAKLMSAGGAVTRGSIAYYADRVRAAAVREQLRETIATFASLSEDETNPVAVLDSLEEQITAMRAGLTESEPLQTIGEAGESYLRGLDDALLTKRHRGIRTGLVPFDRVNGGFQDSTLNIIAARPSNGKSVLGLQFAHQIARGFGYTITTGGEQTKVIQEAIPTLFVSLEMAAEELVIRSIAPDTDVDGRHLVSYRISAEERRRLEAIRDRFQDDKLTVWEPIRATVSKIRAMSRLCWRTKAVRFIVIDYLQFIDEEGKNFRDNESRRIGDICKGIKALARELRIPIVLLCQLGRNAENKVPSLADLADSGKIEQHADTVTAIHRNRSDGEYASLLILKWRNGRTANITVEFHREFCRFGNNPLTAPQEQPTFESNQGF